MAEATLGDACTRSAAGLRAFGRPADRAAYVRGAHCFAMRVRTPDARNGSSEMNPMLWLVAGGVLGWLANIEMGADRKTSLALNVLTGVAGALIAGTLVTSPLEPGAVGSGDLSLGGVLVASLGAILVLALVNLFRLKDAP